MLDPAFGVLQGPTEGADFLLGIESAMPPTYRLPFTCAALPAVSARYTYEAADNLADILPSVQARGHLIQKEFLRIGEWKTRRKRRAREKNTAEYIIAVTHAAFASTNERFRIEALTLLDGVAWPTASVILHFAKDSTYPILDVRCGHWLRERSSRL